MAKRDVVDTPAGWIVSADANDWRGQVWNETRTKLISGGWYSNSLKLTVEE